MSEATTTKADDAILTKRRLIYIKRLMARPEWNVLWSVLKANFVLDESVFQPDAKGAFCPLVAAKRDGQRDVMNFIRMLTNMPTPAEDDEDTEEEADNTRP